MIFDGLFGKRKETRNEVFQLGYNQGSVSTMWVLANRLGIEDWHSIYPLSQKSCEMDQEEKAIEVLSRAIARRKSAKQVSDFFGKKEEENG